MCGFLYSKVWHKVLCGTFGYKRPFRKCLVYSSSDIYFSAITPSATGGQPASAYFMMKDKVWGCNHYHIAGKLDIIYSFNYCYRSALLHFKTNYGYAF
ncbi:MAG: hypothetical protein ACLS4M_06675 [Eubacterium ventriosum]